MLAYQDISNTPVSSVPYVHNAAVDIAKLFEAKKPRTVCGVVEDEGLCACKVNFTLRQWSKRTVDA